MGPVPVLPCLPEESARGRGRLLGRRGGPLTRGRSPSPQPAGLPSPSLQQKEDTWTQSSKASLQLPRHWPRREPEAGLRAPHADSRGGRRHPGQSWGRGQVSSEQVQSGQVGACTQELKVECRMECRRGAWAMGLEAAGMDGGSEGHRETGDRAALPLLLSPQRPARGRS